MLFHRHANATDGMHMNDTSTHATHLNPNVPLSYLSPMDGEFTTRNRDIFVASLAIMVWDVVSSLHEDYRLVWKCDWAWQTLTYIISRLSTLVFLLLAVVLETMPVSHCNIWATVDRVFYVAAHAAISLLFLFRVSAVYNLNRWVVGFFTFAWLTVVAGAALSFLSVTGQHMGPTNHCYLWITGSEEYMIAAVFTQAGFDLLVCVAVSYRLGATVRLRASEGGIEYKRSWSGCVLVTKSGVMWLAERFLRDNQRYFLLAVIFKIPEIVAFFSVHREHGADICLSISFIDTAVMSILAAKIYRKLKLGAVETTQRGRYNTSLSSLSFSSRYRETLSGVKVEIATDVSRSFPPVSIDRDTVTGRQKQDELV